MVADSEELEILDASEMHVRRLKCKGGPHAEKMVDIACSPSQLELPSCMEEIRRTTSIQDQSPCTRRRTQRLSSGRLVRVSAVRYVNG